MFFIPSAMGIIIIKIGNKRIDTTAAKRPSQSFTTRKMIQALYIRAAKTMRRKIAIMMTQTGMYVGNYVLFLLAEDTLSPTNKI